MMDYGFVRVAAAVPELKVAGCSYNADRIIEMIGEAEAAGVQMVVFPELSLTAYTCADLFHQELLLKQSLTALFKVTESTKDLNVLAIVGLPLAADNQLFNCAAVIQKGEILGIVPKTYIPGYKEFYEERWFAAGTLAKSPYVRLLGKEIPFGTDLLFEADGPHTVSFGVEICEDLWAPVPPSTYQAIAGAVILFNLSASNEIIGKSEYRRELVTLQSGKCSAGYVYASSGVDESTTDVVFGGHAMIAENGGILSESERFLRKKHLIISEIDVQKLLNDRIRLTSFMETVAERSFRKIPFHLELLDLGDSLLSSEGRSPGSKGRSLSSGGMSCTSEKLFRTVEPHPFVPSDKAARDIRCGEIFAIQTTGLAKRLAHTGIKNAVLGISGGLDSTLALIVTAKTFDMLEIPRENITAVTMPGFGTTDKTYENAVQLIRSFGAELREIDIKQACLQHFRDIGHDPGIHDVTYENVQARERTQILMDIANKQNGLVIGTGDLSELALGWCTYNGDHMSMYSVNCSIPKTLVKYLVRWAADNVAEQAAAEVLLRILDTPITPELLPPDSNGAIRQKTEELIGPYELHDFFLYHTLRYGASPKKLIMLAKHAFEEIYDAETILKWLKLFYKRFFSQQFKRSCMPDGPKVGTINLSPRGDWRMPSDATAEMWMRELE
jgi:NAD+ synthase (glutamine-hydrolysing)